MPKRLFRRKFSHLILEDLDMEAHRLHRSLNAFDLTVLGVGAIIGVGIFVLTGTAAAKYAGPGIMLSLVISGCACLFTALCYAEFASLMPVAGSAYNYAYATLGEMIAWIIGWDLILEYIVACIAISIGWSGYFVNIMGSMGLQVPAWCASAPGTVPEAIINLPAILVVLFLTALLILGIKESVRFTPFGIYGVMTGAAIIFFAYIGFDALSTVAEETKDPQRNLPIGILMSLLICTVLYILVAGILTGMVPYKELNHPAPVAHALNLVGFKWGSALVSAGALAGITSVLLVMLIGQPRIFFAMSRDGLLWPWIAKVHPRFRTPYVAQILTGTVVALFAGFLDIGTAAELCNIGTLFAFCIVCGGVVVLRQTHPEMKRSFRCPLVPLIPLLGICFCSGLMLSLPRLTWIRFAVWLIAGLAVYFFYGIRHSRMALTL
jgi:APA family basic amino acid/polyamine antiporter